MRKYLFYEIIGYLFYVQENDVILAILIGILKLI